MVFNNQQPKNSEIISRNELYKKMGIGGYPLVQGVDYAGRESWFNSYVTTLLQRDVKDIAQIIGLTELPLLLNLLATRVGTLLNVSELSRTSGISSTTLHRYLILFETLFLIQFLPPWSSNLGKRLVKSPKVYLIDTGLLSFLLGMNLEQTGFEGRIIGPIVEHFVVGELRKQATWSQTRVKMFHFRTPTGIEVDIVLEDAAGNVIGIEVKNSNTVLAQDFKGLKYLAELTGNKFVQGIVLYVGSEHIPFGSKLCALPINSLWAGDAA